MAKQEIVFMIPEHLIDTPQAARCSNLRAFYVDEDPDGYYANGAWLLVDDTCVGHDWLRTCETEDEAIDAAARVFADWERALKRAQNIAAREAVVYTDERKLSSDAADRWTTENLGMRWPEENWDIAYGDSDVPVSALNAEFRNWQRHATLALRIVKRDGLPLTLGSMETAFGQVKER